MKPLLLGLALIAPLALAGCLAVDDRSVTGRRMEGGDIPDTFGQSRLLEHKGLKQMRTGNKLRNERRRREYLDSAMAYFRDARDLYVDELINKPGTPDQQTFLEGEIERLGDLIAHVHRVRPIGNGS